jgi:hypothetical protein
MRNEGRPLGLTIEDRLLSIETGASIYHRSLIINHKNGGRLWD